MRVLEYFELIYKRTLILILFPSIMFLCYNVAKLLTAQLLGLSAVLHYNTISFDTMQIVKLSDTEKILFSSSIVGTGVALIYLVGLVGYFLFLRAVKQNNLLMINIGLFMAAFTFNPILSFIEKIQFMLLKPQTQNNIGEEFRLSKILGLGEWTLPIILSIITLVLWGSIIYKLRESKTRLEVSISVIIAFFVGIFMWSWIGKLILP